jgi:hypothetical protein
VAPGVNASVRVAAVDRAVDIQPAAGTQLAPAGSGPVLTQVA